MLKIAIRADASLIIGKGHIMRCLTLAHYIKATQQQNNVEVDITFICNNFDGNLNHYIEEQGFSVISLNSEQEINKLDTSTWLSRSQQNDAKLCIDNTSIIFDWIIVDHYAIDKNWQQLIQAITHKILVIDDLANRVHDCDVLLDQTLSRDESDYEELTPKACLKLVGGHYTLLRKEFFKHRIKAENKRRNLTSIPFNFHVLITMGGFDLANTSLIAIEALKQLRCTSSKFTATVVLSSQSIHLESLQYCVKGINWLTIELDSQNMATQMLKADIAIGASGATAWERCCLGLPTLSIETAENQKLVSSSLEKQGAIINLGSSNNIEAFTIRNTLVALIDRKDNTYESMINKSFISCDGKGVNRVYQQLFKANVTLRPAVKNDLDLIFSWQSNPQIRQYFRNNEPVTYEEHCKWFNQAIINNKYQFYIITYEKNSIGMVRLDNILEQAVEISILISPEFQGKNIAAIALTKIIKKNPLNTIYAYIDINNIASHKLFQKANFTQVSDVSYRLFPAEIIYNKGTS
jgi:UDP-2,4-diacetamido-2,4,6-trideoxy-beta-L-altropyranose hydrolase